MEFQSHVMTMDGTTVLINAIWGSWTEKKVLLWITVIRLFHNMRVFVFTFNLTRKSKGNRNKFSWSGCKHKNKEKDCMTNILFLFFCILVATAAGIGIVSMNICTLWKAIAIQSKHLLLLPLKMSACVSSSRHSEITVTYDLIPHRYFSGINIRLNNVTYCKCVFCLLLQERHLVSLLYNLKVCVCVCVL